MYVPTQVLLFKRLPFDTTQQDLIELCKNFGELEDICMIKGKGYAFVQFKELEAAKKCYQTFQDKQPAIRDSKIFTYYTGKSHLVRKESGMKNRPNFMNQQSTYTYEEPAAKQLVFVL
mmetsp:Transcript_44965/g.62525  ORF Transcript_44965/g.62525 Transcript_44965/m.62525 type:complete len:118 (-) Transcript_44965:343-696(-)